MSIPPFDIPLWVIYTAGSIALVLLYATIGSVVAAITRRHDNELDGEVAAGIFWPFVIVLFIIMVVPIFVYHSLTKVFKP